MHLSIQIIFLPAMLVGQVDERTHRTLEATFGYHLQTPDGWRRVPKSLIGGLPDDVRAALGAFPIDKDCVELLISQMTPTAGPAICQVIVKPRPPIKDLGDWERTRLHDNPPDWFQIQNESDGMPMALDDLTGGWTLVGGRRTYVTGITGTRRWVHTKLKGWQTGWYVGSSVFIWRSSPRTISLITSPPTSRHSLAAFRSTRGGKLG